MTDDELALLRMIRENPDADLPRLVYADWLEERGQGDRAEFIRLQIERYRRISTDPTAKGISWREYQLLETHELMWKAELPPGFRTGAAFRRGLIHRVHCRVRDLFAATEAELAAPIEVLTVIVDELNIEWLSAVPLAFQLPLRELTITCEVPVGPVLAQLLVRCGPFPFLHTLRIHDSEFGDDGVNILCPLPTFPAVKYLDLSGCGLTDHFILYIDGFEWLDQLARLTVADNHFRYTAPEDLHPGYPHVQID